MADIERWTDVVVPEPASDDPLMRMGIELGLASRLLPWADGRPATTYFERLFQRPISAVTETRK